MKDLEKKITLWELHKDAACCFEQILEAALHKTAVVWPFTSYLTNYQSEMSTAKEIKTKSWVTFSYGLLHMDTSILSEQQKLTFISSVWTLGAV